MIQLEKTVNLLINAEYTFSLMKHYFDNGVSVYSFWNSVLDETGRNICIATI